MNQRLVTLGHAVPTVSKLYASERFNIVLVPDDWLIPESSEKTDGVTSTKPKK